MYTVIYTHVNEKQYVSLHYRDRKIKNLSSQVPKMLSTEVWKPTMHAFYISSSQSRVSTKKYADEAFAALFIGRKMKAP